MEQLSLFTENSGHGVVLKTKRAQNAPVFIGQRYNDLTIIGFAGRIRGRYKKSGVRYTRKIWACRCECGTIVNVEQSNLRHGSTKSCGCYYAKTHILDLKNKRVGMLVVGDKIGPTKYGDIQWLCSCDCGGTRIVLTRYLINKQVTHCGCKSKPSKKQKKKIKRKPVDRKQMANDLYCLYLDGMSLRDIARDVGYIRAGWISTLFKKHIPVYAESSKKRMEESVYRKNQIRYKTYSKKFRYEKDFQHHCVSILKNQGEKIVEYSNQDSGVEIDIKTNTHCYELKTATRKVDLMRAIGQLLINAQATSLKPALIIPSDTEIENTIKEAILRNGIDIRTELDLL